MKSEIDRAFFVGRLLGIVIGFIIGIAICQYTGSTHEELARLGMIDLGIFMGYVVGYNRW